MPTLTLTQAMQARLDQHLRIYNRYKDELRDANSATRFLRSKDNNPLGKTSEERRYMGHQVHIEMANEATSNFRERMQLHWLMKPGDHIEVLYKVDGDTVHKLRCVYDGWVIPRGWGWDKPDSEGPYLKYHLAANPMHPQQFTPRAIDIIQISNRNKYLSITPCQDRN